MGRSISLYDLPEPYRQQAERKLLQELKRRAANQPPAPQKDTRSKKQPKLHNQKVERGGRIFDSKREADRYDELRLLETQGAIRDLECQKEYLLIPAQYKTEERYGANGRRIKDKQVLLERAVTYVADFVYDQDGETVVEDSKGYRNPSSAPYAKFVLKRKLMLWVHGIRVREV